MDKLILARMLAGLKPDERQAVLTSLGISDTAFTTEILGMAAQVTTEANSIQITAPTFQPASAPAQQLAAAVTAPASAAHVDPSAANAGMAALQTELAAANLRAVTAECDAFFSLNANRVSPAEMTDAKKLYVQLGTMPTADALNAYKASVVARPVSHMMTEQVSSTGQVLLNSQPVDNRTEDERAAAEITAFLNLSQGGKEALAAVKSGKVEVSTNHGKFTHAVDLASTLKQFAISVPEGVV